MSTQITKNQWIPVIGFAVIVTFLSGVGGLIVGAWYGGNYGNSFEFNGVRGYEAIGQIGMAIGAVVGGALSCWITIMLIRPRNLDDGSSEQREK